MKKKIVILGCENSHANNFLAAITKNSEEFSDVDVIGVYSDEIEEAKKLNEKYGVAIMENYDDAVGKVDGVVITARHGDNHYKYAKPYIASGIPMFIDKPIAISETEVVEFMRDLRDHGVRVSGGSSLKHMDEVMLLRDEREKSMGGVTISGFIQAPLYPDPQYGGFFFYAQHLVEMVCEIFGRFPLSVLSKRNGKEIHTIFHYEDYDCVGLYSSTVGHYHVIRIAKDYCKSCAIPDNLGGNYSYREFKEYHNILNGGKQKNTYEEFASPVFIMNAIYRSLESGKEEPVGRPVL